MILLKPVIDSYLTGLHCSITMFVFFLFITGGTQSQPPLYEGKSEATMVREENTKDETLVFGKVDVNTKLYVYQVSAC